VTGEESVDHSLEMIERANNLKVDADRSLACYRDKSEPLRVRQVELKYPAAAAFSKCGLSVGLSLVFC